MTPRLGRRLTPVLGRGRRRALLGAVGLVVPSVALAVALTVSPQLGAAQPQPGSLDTTFGTASTPGTVTSSAGDGATGVAYVSTGADAGDLAVSSGNLVVSAGSLPPTSEFQVGLFTASGAVDTRFAGGVVNAFTGGALAVTTVPTGTAAGDVVAAGWIKPSSPTCGSGGQDPVIAEFTPAGSLVFKADLSALSGCTSQLNAVTVDANGNIVAAGQTTTASLSLAGLVVRLTPTGAPDTTFNGTGFLETFGVSGGENAAFTSVAVVPPVPTGYNSPTGVPATDVGDVVAGGYSITATNGQALTVAAFTAGGAPDTNFAGSGEAQFLPATTATGLTVISATSLSNPQPHLGDVVVAGATSTGVDLVQFQANGTLDPTFGSGGQVAVQSSAPFLQTAIAYQPFGGFLTVAGTTAPTNPQPPPPQFQSTLVGQYNAISGLPNSAFGSNGLVVENGPNNQPASADAVAVQPDGKTVVAGEIPAVNGVENTGLMRFMGPTVSVSNAPTLSVTEPVSVATLSFPVMINEALATSVSLSLSASGSGTVLLMSPCTTPAPFPCGSTTETVQVQVPVTAAVGGSQVNNLTVTAGSGYVPSSTNAVGSGTTENLAAPQTSAMPTSFGALPNNLEVRGDHTPSNGLNLYWEAPTGQWLGRVVVGSGATFSQPALAFTKQNLQLMAVEGPSHTLDLFYELSNGAWAGRIIAGVNSTFSAPALVVNSQNLEVIAVEGPSNSLDLYYEMSNGAWGGRVIAGGGSTFSAPSLALTAQNLELISVEGPSQSLDLYYELSNGAWNGRAITGGGSTASTPSLVVNHQGLEVISVQSPANSLSLYYELSNGGWAGRGLTGSNAVTSAPALVINDPGLEVIAVEGPSNSLDLFYELSDGAWNGRVVAGGGTTFSAPGLIINNQNLEVISAQGPSNSIYLFYEGANGAWNGPVLVAGPGSSG